MSVFNGVLKIKAYLFSCCLTSSFLFGGGEEAENLDTYRHNLKNREWDTEAPRNFCLERESLAERQDASENENYEVKPWLSQTDSLGYVGIPLFYWQQKDFVNFGDYLSVKIVERILNQPVRIYRKRKVDEKKFLALGSILYFARDNDVVWGSGVNGKRLKKEEYAFSKLDVRAVRGPLTRQFLMENFQIECPEIYGDPALLFPLLYPEFQRAASPSRDYSIVLHYLDEKLFATSSDPHLIRSTEPWDIIIKKILDSKFIISTSLHGLILAEAYGIPARMLRLTQAEPLFKYQDYYLGTNRPYFRFATSIEEALKLGGEPPIECNLKKLYEAFPFEYWPDCLPTPFYLWDFR
jgi:pyruvyltransferase